jgi:hypothetical protein
LNHDEDVSPTALLDPEVLETKEYRVLDSRERGKEEERRGGEHPWINSYYRASV